MSAFSLLGNVGEFAYWSGKSNIDKWASQHQNIHSYGASQGGAILELAYRDQKNISEVNLISAPGLVYNNPRWEDHRPEKIRIYMQATDPVAKVGSFPEGKNVSLYLLNLKSNALSRSWFADLFFGWISHIQDCLVTKENININPISNITAMNSSSERLFRTTVHKVISIVMFFLAPLIAIFLEGVIKSCT